MEAGAERGRREAGDDVHTYPELAAASRAPLTPILTEERKIEVSGD